MDRLWAPWRIKYIRNNVPKRCIFCARKDYLIFETKYSSALLNIFPYNNGHIMVSPIRHLSQIAKLKEEEALDLLRTINKAKGLLDEVLKPDGYNIGINISKTAGAGITGHLHIHIVPRWKGDTNFMPVVYKTKIISESLFELHRQLKKALQKDAQSKRD